MKSSWRLALGLLLIGVCATGASATTIVELRFDTGDPNHRVVTANTDYTVDLWVKVIGTDDSKADGLVDLYAALQSCQWGSGTALGSTATGVNAVGFTSFHVNSYWKGSGAQDGNYLSNTKPLASDGIQDWGRYTASPGSGQPGTTIYAVSPLSNFAPQYVANINNTAYAHNITGGSEYLLGTGNIHIGNLTTPVAGAATSFTAVRITPLPGDSNVSWTKAIKPEIAAPDGFYDPNFAQLQWDNYTVGGAVWFLNTTNSQVLITNPDSSNSTTGASTKVVNLGNVLKGATSPQSSTVSISKTGSDYTNFGVTTAGGATSTFTPGLLAAGTQTASGTLGLASTSTYGAVSGTVTISNNSWGGGAGYGQDDAVDVFTVTANVGLATAANSGVNNRNAFDTNLILSGVVAAGGNYAGLSSKTLAGNGALGTEAVLLKGTNPNATAQTVTMNWRTRAQVENTTPLRLLSDIVSVDGMAKTGGQTSGSRQETGLFVVQLNYNTSMLDANTAQSLANRGGFAVGYLNEDYDAIPGPTPGDMWQLAVAGNFGGTASYKFGAFDPATDFVLGRYGIDTSTHTVWAVVDHNSQFAVVPEPGTICLIVAGGIGMILRRRRASRA